MLALLPRSDWEGGVGGIQLQQGRQLEWGQLLVEGGARTLLGQELSLMLQVLVLAATEESAHRDGGAGLRGGSAADVA